MSAEDNKAIARRYWEELWNADNLASIEAIFAPDHIIQNYVERMKHNISRWRTALPDFHASIEDIVAEGDKVAVRWTIRGTIELESGETLPPTGKHVSLAGMDIYHFRGGKIVELRRSWDIAPAALGSAGGVGGKI